MRGIQPNWPAPTWVRALTTTRVGGVSEGTFNSLNLGDHVNDNPVHVAQNRLALSQHYNFMYEPLWLNQSHSTHVIELKSPTSPHPNPLPKGERGSEIEADGVWTQLTAMPCAVLTADCLPILLCDTQGTLVAALHAGWRGLASGIIEKALKDIRLNANGDIMAWLGPAISQQHYELGEEVRMAFLKQNLQSAKAFKPGVNQGKWLGDLNLLAKMRLQEMGVTQVYGGDYCTYTEANQFYSYRRDKQTGRMATLIWLAIS